MKKSWAPGELRTPLHAGTHSIARLRKDGAQRFAQLVTDLQNLAHPMFGGS
jgi:hypothetical protein